MDRGMDSIIDRVPLRTYFAGMAGDTLSMVKFGWELNVHKEHDYARAGLRIRITGRHDGFNLRMISGSLILDYYGARDHLISNLSRVPFEIKIEYMAQNLIIHNPSECATLSRDWNGLMEIRKNANFDDYFGFPEKHNGLIIPENKIWTVQEHLDALRAIQQPDQDEILRQTLDEKREIKQVFKLMAV